MLTALRKSAKGRSSKHANFMSSGSGGAIAAWRFRRHMPIGSNIRTNLWASTTIFPVPPTQNLHRHLQGIRWPSRRTAVVLTAVDDDVTYKVQIVDFTKRAGEGMNLAGEAMNMLIGGRGSSFQVTDFPLWDKGANAVYGVAMMIDKKDDAKTHMLADVVFNKGKLYIITASVPGDSPSRTSSGLARFIDTSQFHMAGYGFNYATGHDYPLGDNDPNDRDNHPARAGLQTAGWRRERGDPGRSRHGRRADDLQSQEEGEKLMKLQISALAAGLALAAIVPAMAHHSFAMFDNAKMQTVDGTVKEFEWVNPHSWLHIMAVNASGVPEEWAFEMGSPGQLTTQGWKKDTVKVGDKVSVSFHPMKDGSHGGSQMSVKLANGTVMGGAGQRAERLGRRRAAP